MMLCQRCGEREAEIFTPGAPPLSEAQGEAVRRALDRVVETPAEPGH